MFKKEKENNISYRAPIIYNFSSHQFSYHIEHI